MRETGLRLFFCSESETELADPRPDGQWKLHGKETVVTWKQWMTAAADQWDSLVKKRMPGSGDLRLQSPGDRVAAVLSADCSGARRRAPLDARRRDGRAGGVPSGLRAISDELTVLAETQRLLAILAATAAREGVVREYSWVYLAEQARLLASRAERASAALAGVRESVTAEVHSNSAGEKS